MKNNITSKLAPINDKHYRLIGKKEESTPKKTYTQMIYLPKDLFLKAGNKGIKYNSYEECQLIPTINGILVLTGIGNFFPTFIDSQLEIQGLCLAPWIDDAPLQNGSCDISEMANFLINHH
ncbi:MAG: hypothetical protein V4496_06120 [Pseudomonadota bacterium]